MRNLSTKIKLFSLFFVITVFLALSASAKTYTGTFENFDWTMDLNTSTLEIKGNGKTPDFDNFEQVPFSRFLPLIKNVIVSDGITEIGSCTFMYASNMKNVKLPSTLKRIGSSAFEHCTTLENIAFPSSLNQIDTMAFSFCTSLKTIDFPDSVTSIGEYAFCCCTFLEKVTLSEKITKIAPGTFSGCESLTNVDKIDNVTHFGEGSFYGCKKLNISDFPSGSSISARAFFNCSSLSCLVPSTASGEIGAFFGSNINFETVFDIDGNEQKLPVSVGNIPVYRETPQKNCVIDGIYNFTGWDKEFVEATTPNNRYTALFSPIKPILSASVNYPEKDKISVNAILDSNRIPLNEAKILFAVYSESGAMISSKKKVISRSDKSSEVVLTLYGKTPKYVKIFVFTDDTLLSPLGEKFTVTLD